MGRWKGYFNKLLNGENHRMHGLTQGISRNEVNAKCIRAGEYINGVEILSDCTNLYRGVRHPGLWGLQRDKADIYYSKFAKDHYLGLHYISRHGYHAKTKHGMYSRTCLFHECQCCIPNLNNR